MWWCGRSPGPRLAAVRALPVPWAPVVGHRGVANPLGPRRTPLGRGRRPGARVAIFGSWPFHWAPSGRRGGMAGPLRPGWPLRGRGRSPGPRLAAVGAWLVPGHRVAAVWMWAVPKTPLGRRGGVAVPCTLSGRRGYVAGPLGPVWLPRGRNRSPGSHQAAAASRPVPENSNDRTSIYMHDNDKAVPAVNQT